MRSVRQGAITVTAIMIGGVVLFAALGMVDLRWPWENPRIHREESRTEQVTEATVTEVEPIALDCRARVHSVVPISAKRDHRMFGQVYRTDSVELEARGDIDTCVDSQDVDIASRSDGSIRVVVPAESIRFERPRVDAVATFDSFEYDKGLVGKLTDAFPWVSDNSELSPAAYAYAQQVIGSSECMDAAYDTTEAAIRRAYEHQLDSRGQDDPEVEVEIIGAPDFDRSSTAIDDLDGFDFTVEEDRTACSVADSATEPTGADTSGGSINPPG